MELAMSALTSAADIHPADHEVRFVPGPDISLSRHPIKTRLVLPFDPSYSILSVELQAMPQEPPNRVERRLSAILAADMAGYSRLMHEDEEATHAKLTALLEMASSPRLRSTVVAS